VPHPRRHRFAILAKQPRSGEDFAALARRAEDLGYSAFLMPDHFVDHPLAPIPGIMAAAAATTTLRIGTLVLANDYTHPVVLAREAATIDLLSGGRLELGIGAGWMTADYRRAGFPLDPPGVRIARLEESIVVMKALMADGEVNYEGEHYRIERLEGQPKPVQRPHPPFTIGGGGPRVLALAARHAAVVGVNANLRAGAGDHPDSVASLTAAATDEKLARLRDSAGDRFDDLELQTLTGFVHVTADRDGITAALAEAFGVPAEVALETPAVLVGTEDQITAELEHRRDRWQISYTVVPEEYLDVLAPVVARLAGT